jgi:hypothetical protein
MKKILYRGIVVTSAKSIDQDILHQLSGSTAFGPFQIGISREGQYLPPLKVFLTGTVELSMPVMLADHYQLICPMSDNKFSFFHRSDHF